jgi:hypothetical protein
VAIAERRRLALAAIVVFRRSKDLDAIFVMFGMFCNSCELMELIRIVPLKKGSQHFSLPRPGNHRPKRAADVLILEYCLVRRGLLPLKIYFMKIGWKRSNIGK